MSNVVFPEKQKINLTVKLSYYGKTVLASLPVYYEPFRLEMRKLGYVWANSTWQKYFNSREGELSHCASELGHYLLSVGFPVEFPDENTKEMALTGSFISSFTRWVLRCNSDKFSGWFYVQWGWNEDYYDKAIKLPDAHYSGKRGSVVIPSCEFEAVIDFAERYDFLFSDKAKEILELAKVE